MADYDHIVRTRTLARVVGPYLALMAVMLLARHDALAMLLPAFMDNQPLILITGAFTLMVGLTMIAAHHHWAGPSAIVISSMGVAAALKGATLMIVPALGAETTVAVTRTPLVLPATAIVLLFVGVWLTFVGWLTKT